MEILFTEKQIQKRVRELAAMISDDYDDDDDLIIIVVMKGAMFFASDLLRLLPIPVEVDILSVESYGKSSAASGAVRLLRDITVDIEDRDVLLVEDIVHTGRTLQYLRNLIQARNPASIKLCSFLNNLNGRVVQVKIDYLGFEVAKDIFVVGYGLDYKERFRTLPYIAVKE